MREKIDRKDLKQVLMSKRSLRLFRQVKANISKPGGNVALYQIIEEAAELIEKKYKNA